MGADVFKGTFRRNGEGDYHCSREAVEAMLRDRCPETADNCLLDEMTIADLDDDSVRRYRMIFNIFALIDVGERSGMGLSNFYSVWDECGYDRPIIEELHEPDQTVLTVKLDASDLRKTSRKKTSTKSTKLWERKLVQRARNPEGWILA